MSDEVRVALIKLLYKNVDDQNNLLRCSSENIDEIILSRVESLVAYKYGDRQ